MHEYILAKLKEKKSESDIFYYQTEKFQYNFYNIASPIKQCFVFPFDSHKWLDFLPPQVVRNSTTCIEAGHLVGNLTTWQDILLPIFEPKTKTWGAWLCQVTCLCENCQSRKTYIEMGWGCLKHSAWPISDIKFSFCEEVEGFPTT